jgi:hypothetical protein
MPNWESLLPQPPAPNRPAVLSDYYDPQKQMTNSLAAANFLDETRTRAIQRNMLTRQAALNEQDDTYQKLRMSVPPPTREEIASGKVMQDQYGPIAIDNFNMLAKNAPQAASKQNQYWQTLRAQFATSRRTEAANLTNALAKSGRYDPEEIGPIVSQFYPDVLTSNALTSFQPTQQPGGGTNALGGQQSPGGINALTNPPVMPQGIAQPTRQPGAGTAIDMAQRPDGSWTAPTPTGNTNAMSGSPMLTAGAPSTNALAAPGAIPGAMQPAGQNPQRPTAVSPQGQYLTHSQAKAEMSRIIDDPNMPTAKKAAGLTAIIPKIRDPQLVHQITAEIRGLGVAQRAEVTKAPTEIGLIEESHQVDAQGQPTPKAKEARRTLYDIEQMKVRITRESRQPPSAKDKLQVTTDKDGDIAVVDLTTGKARKVTYGNTGETVKALPKRNQHRAFPWETLQIGGTYQGKKVINVGRDKAGKPVQVLLEGDTAPVPYTPQVK